MTREDYERQVGRVQRWNLLSAEIQQLDAMLAGFDEHDRRDPAEGLKFAASVTVAGHTIAAAPLDAAVRQALEGLRAERVAQRSAV